MDFKKIGPTNNVSPLVHLDLWAPPQGCDESCIPIEVDLGFGIVEWSKGTRSFQSKIRSAKLTLVLTSAEIIRGSRYGDFIHEPYDVHRVIEQSKEAREDARASGTGAALTASIEKGPGGNVDFKTGKETRKRNEESITIEKNITRRRVIPLGENCWQIREIDGLGVLEGKYLGVQNGASSSPLCIVSGSTECRFQVYITISVRDLTTEILDQNWLSRNKQAVVDYLLGSRAEVKPEFRINPADHNTCLASQGEIKRVSN